MVAVAGELYRDVDITPPPAVVVGWKKRGLERNRFWCKVRGDRAFLVGPLNVTPNGNGGAAVFDDVTKKLFWSKVDKSAGVDGCWPWTGYVTTKGYGLQRIAGKYKAVHRVIYQIVNGPLDDSLVMDHLCRNRRCCNPAHLEPVTSQENTLRGVGITAVNAKRTHCKNGHQFTPENTHFYKTPQGGRHCKKCNSLNMISYRAKKRAAKLNAADRFELENGA